VIGAIIAKRKVRSAFDPLNRRDVLAFLANWAEDAVFIYPGSLSVSGRVEGKKAIEQWYKKFLEQFPKVNFTVKKVFVQNIFALGGTNVFAMEYNVVLTNREGETFKKNCVAIIHTKKGKAVLVREYIDTEVDRKAWGENKI
jgi:ketosteroid isomerase-like protein